MVFVIEILRCTREICWRKFFSNPSLQWKLSLFEVVVYITWKQLKGEQRVHCSRLLVLWGSVGHTVDQHDLDFCLYLSTRFADAFWLAQGQFEIFHGWYESWCQWHQRFLQLTFSDGNIKLQDIMFKARQYENTICSSFNKCKEKSSFRTGLFLVAHHKETEDGRCIPIP